MKPTSGQHTQVRSTAIQTQAEQFSLRLTRSDDSEMQMRNTTRATEQQPTEESSLHQTRSYDPGMQMRNTTRALNDNLLRVLSERDYQARIEPKLSEEDNTTIIRSNPPEPESIDQEALLLLSELPVDSLSESQITIESQTVQLEEFFSEIQDYMEKFAKGKGEYNQKYYNHQESRNVIQSHLKYIVAAKDFQTKLDILEHLFEFYIEESTGQIEEKEALEAKVKEQDQEKLMLEQEKEALEQEKREFSDFMFSVLDYDMKRFVECKDKYNQTHFNHSGMRNRVKKDREEILAQENFSKKLELLRNVFKTYFREATTQTMEKEKLALEQEQKEKEYLDNISETVFTYHQDTSDLRAENKKQQEKLQETKHLLEEKTQEVALLDQQLKAETSKTEALELEIQRLKAQLENKEVEVQRLNTAKEQHRKQAMEYAENLKKHMDIYLNQNK